MCLRKRNSLWLIIDAVLPEILEISKKFTDIKKIRNAEESRDSTKKYTNGEWSNYLAINSNVSILCGWFHQSDLMIQQICTCSGIPAVDSVSYHFLNPNV